MLQQCCSLSRGYLRVVIGPSLRCGGQLHSSEGELGSSSQSSVGGVDEDGGEGRGGGGGEGVLEEGEGGGEEGLIVLQPLRIPANSHPGVGDPGCRGCLGCGGGWDHHAGEGGGDEEWDECGALDGLFCSML